MGWGSEKLGEGVLCTSIDTEQRDAVISTGCSAVFWNQMDTASRLRIHGHDHGSVIRLRVEVWSVQGKAMLGSWRENRTYEGPGLIGRRL